MSATEEKLRAPRKRLDPLPILVDSEAAALALGIGLTLFEEINTTGELGPSSHRIGRRVLWNVNELQAWVNAGRPRRDKWKKTWTAAA